MLLKIDVFASLEFRMFFPLILSISTNRDKRLVYLCGDFSEANLLVEYSLSGHNPIRP